METGNTISILELYSFDDKFFFFFFHMKCKVEDEKYFNLTYFSKHGFEETGNQVSNKVQTDEKCEKRMLE